MSESEPTCYWEEDLHMRICPKHGKLIGECPINSYIAGDRGVELPKIHTHEWWVISTILSTVELLVQCRICDQTGRVPSPSRAEWTAAFTAPSKPYRWLEPDRVHQP